MMARLRHAATQNGDYERMFDARGLLHDSVFNDPNSGQAQTLWERYRSLKRRTRRWSRRWVKP
ncbi:MAG: hypothetical protein NZ585_05270 [Chloracidobacterium sp.]|nr:hypothetical protein [Chloracidobacterium sp.]